MGGCRPHPPEESLPSHPGCSAHSYSSQVPGTLGLHDSIALVIGDAAERPVGGKRMEVGTQMVALSVYIREGPALVQLVIVKLNSWNKGGLLHSGVSETKSERLLWPVDEEGILLCGSAFSR
jgi:hypothetical protein